MPVKRVGDWTKAGLLIRNLKPDIKKANTLALMQVGLKAESLMVKFIQRQPGTWPSLNEQYLERKTAEGKSNQMLIATSSMISAITSSVKYPNVFVGVKRNKVSKDGENIANIAAVMAFGTRDETIPARDFLTPPMKQVLRAINQERLFARILMQLLKRKYGI